MISSKGFCVSTKDACHSKISATKNLLGRLCHHDKKSLQLSNRLFVLQLLYGTNFVPVSVVQILDERLTIGVDLEVLWAY